MWPLWGGNPTANGCEQQACPDGQPRFSTPDTSAEPSSRQSASAMPVNEQFYGISLNIQGLTNKKVTYLKDSCTETKVFAICLCETWLNPDIENNEIGIDGYHLYRADRVNRARGGTAIYLNKNFPVNNPSI